MSARLTFGPYVLDPGAGTLCRQGVPVPLGYRGFLLLSAFLDRPGEVLTKSDLIDAAWQGAAVEETNLTVQIASLRKHIGTSPGGGDWIATIPRVGYRFVGAVGRQADRPNRPGAVSDADEPGGRPSIAVLPFLNLSDDREQEYFADGIAEDIITGLSRLRWLFVIARNSTYPYKGEAAGRPRGRPRPRRALRARRQRAPGRRTPSGDQPPDRREHWGHRLGGPLRPPGGGCVRGPR